MLSVYMYRLKLWIKPLRISRAVVLGSRMSLILYSLPSISLRLGIIWSSFVVTPFRLVEGNQRTDGIEVLEVEYITL